MHTDARYMDNGSVIEGDLCIVVQALQGSAWQWSGQVQTIK